MKIKGGDCLWGFVLDEGRPYCVKFRGSFFFNLLTIEKKQLARHGWNQLVDLYRQLSFRRSHFLLVRHHKHEYRCRLPFKTNILRIQYFEDSIVVAPIIIDNRRMVSFHYSRLGV